MSTTPHVKYLYALVNPGFEAALKEEVLFRTPEARPSFSKPGFVTFKVPEGFRKPRWTYFRILGEFVGKGTSHDAQVYLSSLEPQVVVHRTSLSPFQVQGSLVPKGGDIADIIEVNPGEYWWGRRQVGPHDWGTPGGSSPFTLPSGAPSRAWLKLEEMLAWVGWEPTPEMTILELGSAPGGATSSLLRRGSKVWGVDLAPMDDSCLQNPRYTHLNLSIRDLRKKHLPEQIDVLFCDLSLKPVEAVPQLCHIVRLFPSVQRIFYTLKLGDALKAVEIDRFLARFVEMNFHVRTTQLPSHRSEIFVYASRTVPQPKKTADHLK